MNSLKLDLSSLKRTKGSRNHTHNNALLPSIASRGSKTERIERPSPVNTHYEPLDTTRLDEQHDSNKNDEDGKFLVTNVNVRLGVSMESKLKPHAPTTCKSHQHIRIGGSGTGVVDDDDGGGSRYVLSKGSGEAANSYSTGSSSKSNHPHNYNYNCNSHSFASPRRRAHAVKVPEIIVLIPGDKGQSPSTSDEADELLKQEEILMEQLQSEAEKQLVIGRDKRRVTTLSSGKYSKSASPRASCLAAVTEGKSLPPQAHVAAVTATAPAAALVIPAPKFIDGKRKLHNIEETQAAFQNHNLSENEQMHNHFQDALNCHDNNDNLTNPAGSAPTTSDSIVIVNSRENNDHDQHNDKVKVTTSSYDALISADSPATTRPKQQQQQQQQQPHLQQQQEQGKRSPKSSSTYRFGEQQLNYPVSVVNGLVPSAQSQHYAEMAKIHTNRPSVNFTVSGSSSSMHAANHQQKMRRFETQVDHEDDGDTSSVGGGSSIISIPSVSRWKSTSPMSSPKPASSSKRATRTGTGDNLPGLIIDGIRSAGSGAGGRHRTATSQTTAATTTPGHFEFENHHFSPPSSSGAGADSSTGTGVVVTHPAQQLSYSGLVVGESGMLSSTKRGINSFQESDEWGGELGSPGEGLDGGSSFYNSSTDTPRRGAAASMVGSNGNSSGLVKRSIGHYTAIFSLFDNGTMSPAAAASARAKRMNKQQQEPEQQQEHHQQNRSSPPSHYNSQQHNASSSSSSQPSSMRINSPTHHNSATTNSYNNSNSIASARNHHQRQHHASVDERDNYPAPLTAGKPLVQRSSPRDRMPSSSPNHLNNTGSSVSNSSSHHISPSLLNIIRWDPQMISDGEDGAASGGVNVSTTSSSWQQRDYPPYNDNQQQIVLAGDRGNNDASIVGGGSSSSSSSSTAGALFPVGSIGAAALRAAQVAALVACNSSTESDYFNYSNIEGTNSSYNSDTNSSQELKGEKILSPAMNTTAVPPPNNNVADQIATQPFTSNDAITVDPPTSPQAIIRNRRDLLTDRECTEILSYKKVYFVGNKIVKGQYQREIEQQQKPQQLDLDLEAQGQSQSQSQQETELYNFGYDSADGNYNAYLGDHIGFRYEILGLLGAGSFGDVYRCRDHKSQVDVAIKVIKNQKRFSDQAVSENEILRAVRWDRSSAGGGSGSGGGGGGGVQEKGALLRVPIIQLYDTFDFRCHTCFVFPLYGLNMYEFLKQRDFVGLSVSQVKKVAKQLLHCLAYLRQRHILHCDIKPENILIKDEKTMEIVLIDFGSSCYENETVYSYIQSRFYRAPEIILKMPYGPEIDMWSFACILPELRISYPAFPGEGAADQLDCIQEVLGEPPTHFLQRSADAAKATALASEDTAGIGPGGTVAVTTTTTTTKTKTKTTTSSIFASATATASTVAAVASTAGANDDVTGSESVPVTTETNATTDLDGGDESKDDDNENNNNNDRTEGTDSVRENSDTDAAVAASSAQDSASFSSSVSSSAAAGRVPCLPPGKRIPGARSIGDLINARYRDKEFVAFLEQCLRWCPEERLTPENALVHPWITSK